MCLYYHWVSGERKGARACGTSPGGRLHSTTALLSLGKTCRRKRGAELSPFTDPALPTPSTPSQPTRELEGAPQESSTEGSLPGTIILPSSLNYIFILIRVLQPPSSKGPLLPSCRTSRPPSSYPDAESSTIPLSRLLLPSTREKNQTSLSSLPNVTVFLLPVSS